MYVFDDALFIFFPNHIKSLQYITIICIIVSNKYINKRLYTHKIIIYIFFLIIFKRINFYVHILKVQFIFAKAN